LHRLRNPRVTMCSSRRGLHLGVWFIDRTTESPSIDGFLLGSGEGLLPRWASTMNFNLVFIFFSSLRSPSSPAHGGAAPIPMRAPALPLPTARRWRPSGSGRGQPAMAARPPYACGVVARPRPLVVARLSPAPPPQWEFLRERDRGRKKMTVS
jgi:hypothetical protein